MITYLAKFSIWLILKFILTLGLLPGLCNSLLKCTHLMKKSTLLTLSWWHDLANWQVIIGAFAIIPSAFIQHKTVMSCVLTVWHMPHAIGYGNIFTSAFVMIIITYPGKRKNINTSVWCGEWQNPLHMVRQYFRLNRASKVNPELKQTNKDDYLPCDPFKLVIPSHKEVSDRIPEIVTAFACTASFIALLWGSKSPPVLASPNLVRQFSWASEWS